MDSKHPLASKTIWGAIITVLGMLGQQFGLELTGSETTELAGALATVGGAVLAIYGRFKAKGKIGNA